MPKSRRSRATHYAIQITAARKPFAITLRQWAAYVSAKLIVPIEAHPRLARLRDQHVEAVLGNDGALQLIDHAADGVHMRTNSQVIDRLWVLADAGQVTLTAEERSREAEIRRRFEPPVARELIHEMRTRQREWRIREQYGWWAIKKKPSG